jgi:ubiquinone/menaquinone biosynthesis C-methylase UbiE
MIERNDDFTKMLLRAAKIDGNIRVLDAGCGVGDVTFMVSQMLGGQGSVVGVDIDPAALDTACRRAEEDNHSNAAFQLADVGALPENIGAFDIIVGRRVLMYLRDAMFGIVARLI